MDKKKESDKIAFNYRSFLLEKFEERKMRNKSYSLRAFSRDLGFPPSRLSEILNGKVGLSEKKALEVAESLQLSKTDKVLFIDLVLSEHARSTVEKEQAQSRLRNRLLDAVVLKNEDFFLISDWYNFALIELVRLPGEHSIEVFSKKLGLSNDVVADAMSGLERLGYIKKNSTGWAVANQDLTTQVDIPSAAIRKHHAQLLDKAKSALESKPVEERDFSSFIFALNREQLDYAKERLRSFRRSLVKELEEMPNRDAVYCLSLQLFELTEKE